MKVSKKEKELYAKYIESKKHGNDAQYKKALKELVEYRYNHGNA